jgi:hypothetical protein
VVYAREKTGAFLKYFLETAVKAVIGQIAAALSGSGYLSPCR